MRLVDFQVYLFAGLPREETKAVNHSFFPVYQTVRLWLKERNVEAPFRKIVITVKDARFGTAWHGTASVALSICEVTEGVDVTELRAHHREVAWTAALTRQGLAHLEAAIGWKDEALVSFVESLATTPPPYAHRFPKLHRAPRGLSCDCWFEASVGHSAVKVRVESPDGRRQEVTLAEKPGPLFLEDDFPVAKARLDGGAYVLLDRDDRELARVALPV